ncbi:hypothetical protein T484DRAFT_1814665, partial [Baffinella frigidus]
QARGKAAAAARAAQSAVLPVSAAERVGAVEAPREGAADPDPARELPVSSAAEAQCKENHDETERAARGPVGATEAAEQDSKVHATSASGCEEPAEEEGRVGTLLGSLRTKSGDTATCQLSDNALAELSSMIKELLQNAVALAAEAAAAAAQEAAAHQAYAPPCSQDCDHGTSCPAALAPEPRDTLPTATHAEEGASHEARARGEDEGEDEGEAPAVEEVPSSSVVDSAVLGATDASSLSSDMACSAASAPHHAHDDAHAAVGDVAAAVEEDAASEGVCDALAETSQPVEDDAVVQREDGPASLVSHAPASELSDEDAALLADAETEVEQGDAQADAQAQAQEEEEARAHAKEEEEEEEEERRLFAEAEGQRMAATAAEAQRMAAAAAAAAGLFSVRWEGEEADAQAQAQAQEEEEGRGGAGVGRDEAELGLQLDSFELSMSEVGGGINELSMMSGVGEDGVGVGYEEGELSISEVGVGGGGDEEGYEEGYDEAASPEFESGSGEEDGASSEQ